MNELGGILVTTSRRVAISIPQPLARQQGGISQRMKPESCDSHVLCCNHELARITLIRRMPTSLLVDDDISGYGIGEGVVSEAWL